MKIVENKWILVVLVMLCWALAASFMTGYYYFQYTDLSTKVKERIISSNFGINYGNGTILWFNETKINAGSTLLDLTILLVSVNYTETSLGASINAIDRVPNSYPEYWMWWSHSSYGWTFGPVACDKYVVGDNETMLWYRQDITNYPNLSPP